MALVGPDPALPQHRRCEGCAPVRSVTSSLLSFLPSKAVCKLPPSCGEDRPCRHGHQGAEGLQRLREPGGKRCSGCGHERSRLLAGGCEWSRDALPCIPARPCPCLPKPGHVWSIQGLLQVSRIMSSIHENLEAIETESAQQSVVSLLVVLSAYRPLLVAVSLLKFSAPQDRFVLHGDQDPEQGMLQDSHEDQGSPPQAALSSITRLLPTPWGASPSSPSCPGHPKRGARMRRTTHPDSAPWSAALAWPCGT